MCVLRCGLIQGSADTYLMCNDRLGRLCTASVVIRDFRSDRSVHIKTGFDTKKKRRVFPIGHAKYMSDFVQKNSCIEEYENNE